MAETENILKGVSIGATEKKYNYYIGCACYEKKADAEKKAVNVKKKTRYSVKVKKY